MTDDETHPELTSKSSKLVGVSSAGIRALMYQFTTFYLRTPVKLFRPTRVDYMAITRLFVNGSTGYPKGRPYSFMRDSSLGVLIQAVKKFGWKFIPERVLPPLLANSLTGVVLYTSYLVSLQHFNGDKTNFLDNPSPWDTLRAGFVAGAFQSIAAVPIDAIYARSSANEILKGEHTNLWTFGLKKLRDIGVTGVFAGYSLSFVKESVGFAVYFCVFETIKNQLYIVNKNSYINYQYYKARIMKGLDATREEYFKMVEHQKKFKFFKTCYVFIGGICASFSLLSIQYPITKIQNIHYSRLEAFDIFNSSRPRSKWLTIYYNTYLDTLDHIIFIQKNSKLSWFDWLYRGFRRHALSTIPATTVGLVTLEWLRNKLSDGVEETFNNDNKLKFEH